MELEVSKNGRDCASEGGEGERQREREREWEWGRVILLVPHPPHFDSWSHPIKIVPVRHREAEHHTCLSGLATRAQQQQQQQRQQQQRQQQRQQQHKQRDVTEGQTAGLATACLRWKARQTNWSKWTDFLSFICRWRSCLWLLPLHDESLWRGSTHHKNCCKTCSSSSSSSSTVSNAHSWLDQARKKKHTHS